MGLIKLLMLSLVTSLNLQLMKNSDNFPRKFLSICFGISMVLASSSLFVISIQSSFASKSVEAIPNSLELVEQTGTSENYISLGIKDDFAYWVVFNEDDGYKFRKSSIKGSHWGLRTK